MWIFSLKAGLMPKHIETEQQKIKHKEDANNIEANKNWWHKLFSITGFININEYESITNL